MRTECDCNQHLTEKIASGDTRMRIVPNKGWLREKTMNVTKLIPLCVDLTNNATNCFTHFHDHNVYPSLNHFQISLIFRATLTCAVNKKSDVLFCLSAKCRDLPLWLRRPSVRKRTCLITSAWFTTIETLRSFVLFIYLFYLKFSRHIYIQKQKTKYSEHKIVGLNINKHAAWHCRALNLIKSRWLHATGYRH